MSRWRETTFASVAGMLLISWSGIIAHAQGVNPPPAPPADNAAAADDTAPSSRWPLRLDTSEGLITIYQPQLQSFDGNQIKARAAVSVLASGQQEPVFGAMWMESRVSTDRVARTVKILDVTVTEARFPSSGGLTADTLTDVLRAYNESQETVLLSLDQLSSMLEDVEQEKEAVNDLPTEAPKILFVDHPAVLVVYDGEPKLMQVPDSQLMQAMNTPFFVVLDPASKRYYLKGGEFWYSAAKPLGPFQPAAQVPAAVSTLEAASGEQNQRPSAEGAPDSPVEIITATEPTELVWTDGPEEMGTIPNTDLLYVSNTPSDVFLDINSQQIFVLLSGRWYSAANRSGPWTYVSPDQLPPDFARISPDSDQGDVLASVAGTQQADDAVADTFIPQTATIDRRNFEQPPVEYDGDPSFQAIENSPVQYAVNTPNSVLQVNNQYYCCYNACWYQARVPRGPWSICTSVPREIYLIPPSCPVYSCRFVYVYDSTPDLVYVGYTPGYTGCYRFRRVVVFGTGFRYGPWIGMRFFARPWTFGLAARYNIFSNHWGFRVGRPRIGGPAWFRPLPGPAFGGFFGYGGYRPVRIRGGPGQVVRPRAGFNLYSRRNDVRPDGPRRINTARPGARPINVRPATPTRGTRERNNVFAGSDGQVYRNTLDGWQQRRNNRWESQPNNPTGRPSGGRPTDNQRPNRQPSNDSQANQQPPNRQPSNRPPPDQEQSANQASDRQRPSRGPQSNPPSNAARPGAAAPAELNRDYRARVRGNQRTNSSPPPSRDNSSPRESRGGGNSGGGSGPGGRGGGGPRGSGTGGSGSPSGGGGTGGRGGSPGRGGQQ